LRNEGPPARQGTQEWDPNSENSPFRGSLLLTECKGPIDICDALEKRGDTFGCHPSPLDVIHPLLRMNSRDDGCLHISLSFFWAKYPTFVKFRKICVTKFNDSLVGKKLSKFEKQF